MLHPSWSVVSAYMSEYWSVIIATVIFASVSGITIYYTVNQLNKNISLSLMKAVRVRTKKYKKLEDKVPAASPIWRKELGSRSKGLKCCVCLKSVSSPQYLGGPSISVIFVVPLHILVAQEMHTKIANAFLWLVWTMSFTNGLYSGSIRQIALKKTRSVAIVMNLAVELFSQGLQFGTVCGVNG